MCIALFVTAMAWSGNAYAPKINAYNGYTLLIQDGNPLISCSTIRFKGTERGLGEAIGVGTLSDRIKRAIAVISEKYGLDYKQIYDTIECESGFKHDIYGDGLLAYGVAQFHKPTFEKYCQGDYYDMYDQLDCLGLMWSRGLQSQWSCYNRLYGKKVATNLN